MAKKTVLSTLAVNIEADAFGSLLDGGFIDIYGGEQPDSADAAIGNQPIAVTLALGTPAFGRAVDGVIAANPINPGVAAASVNPVRWARLYRSDHKTKVFDVSVGTSNATMILPTTNIPAGITVSISSFSHTVIKADQVFGDRRSS